MTKTLGKANTICRVLSPRHSAKSYFLKNQILFQKCLPSVCLRGTRHIIMIYREQHSATRNSKNKKIFKKKLVVECVVVWHSAKSPLTTGLALWPFLFAESQTAHGKNFAECPINGTRQSWLCRYCLWRVVFAECYTQRIICRVFYVFCRVFRVLGKLKESGSDRGWDPYWDFIKNKKTVKR